MPSRLRLLHLFIVLGLLLTSACAPNSPTEAPTSRPASPTPTPVSQQVTFTTPDGASLEGIVHGSGDVAVIFSVMGNCKRGWEDMADLVAQNGMTALTYQWRGCKESGGVDEDEIQKFVDDLRGAITFMREQGAKKIILVGASLGGCASAKLTVESQADGLIVVASPPEISEWGFTIKASDIDSSIPKLFVTAENDDTVSADKTRTLFDLAAEPKQWQTYPGTAHGTDLFDTQNKGEFQQRILEFILKVAST